MTITVGTDTYVTVEEADAYYAQSLDFDTWDALDTTQKERALVTATRTLDRQVWQGTKTDPLQDLQWPKTNVVDRDGNVLDPLIVPEDIKTAEIVLALMLYLDPTVASNKNAGTNIKHLKAGSAEVEYFRPQTGGRFPTIIMELIGQYLASATQVSMGGADYGTDQCSNFTCKDKFGFTEGIS